MLHEGIKGLLAIVIASLLWGTTGVTASYTTDLSPLAIGAFTMGVGGVWLSLAARKSLVRDYRKLRLHPKLVFFGALCVVIYPLAFYSSMFFAGVAIGTMVSIASAPLFAAILERLFSKKPISTQWFISFLFGALGIMFLALGKAPINASTESSNFMHVIGVALGLVAGLAYAGYSWVAKQLIDLGANSKSAIAIQFACAALFLLPSLWFTGENLFTNQINISIVFYMATVPMFFGYLLFSYGLRTISASNATLITLIEPLFATLLAILIVGEKFLSIGWFGMALICFCLLVQSINVHAIRQQFS